MPNSLAKRLQIFFPFACGYFLSYLYRVVNAVIAPDLVATIGIGPAELGLLTSAYFITFAAFQLPLGVLLDRVGPRRVEATLLIFAGLGAFIFARSHSVTGLIIGRALIGFGVSACLMAAFKAFAMWFSRQQLPAINGFQMAAGGLGALTATAPVEAALQFTDWRGVFTVLAVLTIAVALLIFFMVPDREPEGGKEDMSAQLRGVANVFKSIVFWRIAPWAVMSQASFLSIHGLWSGPWLRDVAGLSRTTTANVLFWVATAMVFGFISMGSLTERLSRAGVRPIKVAAAGMFVFMMIQALVILELTDWALPLWVCFGIFGTTGILPYAVLSQSFPAHLTGRVNTALNLLVFIAAFAAQWGIGAVINLWPVAASGGYAPAGYQAAFSVMLGLQTVTFLWFVVASRIHKNG